MKYILSCILLVVFHTLHAQNDSLQWKPGFTKEIGESEVWSSDLMGNLLITRRNVIEKYDSSGVQRFSQSIRSIGKISRITPMNTMKLLVFSEEQQSICFLDNTLTLSETCLDLSENTLVMASHVAVSGQSDRIWVMDQFNSRLLSLQLGKVSNHQEIRNVKGLLNIDQINGILEFNNDLYLLDRGKGIYQFDQYGTLMKKFDEKEVNSFGFSGKSMLILQKDSLKLVDLESDNSLLLPLPVKDVIEFSVVGEVFFFRTVDKIFRYRLSLTE